MREALHRCDPPCIPYLGMYLTDLSFIEEGTPDFTPDGLLNFSKMRMVSFYAQAYVLGSCFYFLTLRLRTLFVKFATSSRRRTRSITSTKSLLIFSTHLFCLTTMKCIIDLCVLNHEHHD